MKIRSKALWQYLSDCGAFQGTQEDIIRAKRQYRLEYQRKWKNTKAIKPIELRPGFTPKQYYFLKSRAYEINLNPTSYIKQLALASLNNHHVIPNKDALLKVLQLTSRAINNLPKHHSSYALLLESEAILLTYLKEPRP